MLNVYFDATSVWLGKIVRNPLLSVLQDPALDLDLSAKLISKGFATKFGALFALRSNKSTTTSSTSSSASDIDEGKFVKLKVRVKGIVDALTKAVEKHEIPSGLLEFWKRLTSDGLYFPKSVRLEPQNQSKSFGLPESILMLMTLCCSPSTSCFQQKEELSSSTTSVQRGGSWTSHRLKAVTVTSTIRMALQGAAH